MSSAKIERQTRNWVPKVVKRDERCPDISADILSDIQSYYEGIEGSDRELPCPKTKYPCVCSMPQLGPNEGWTKWFPESTAEGLLGTPDGCSYIITFTYERRSRTVIGICLEAA